MRILVTGASGVLGSQVTERLKDHGQQVIAMSRRPPAGPDWRQADIASGEGLDSALRGAELVVHAASAAAEVSRIKRTDIDGTNLLLRAAERSGVRHVVFISIVGVDRIDYGYYRAKFAAENAIRVGGVPWSILRATQFHELIDRFLRATARGPLVFVFKGLSAQPVSSGEVADRLVELALGEPTLDVEDFGGPEVLDAGQIARTWLGRREQRRRVVRIPVPGKPGPGFRAGYNLAPESRRGKQTWAEWLDQAYRHGRVPTAYSKRTTTER